MAIRSVKFQSILKTYEERQAFKEKSGDAPTECLLKLDSINAEPTLRLVGRGSNAVVKTHLALYHVSEDTTSHKGMVVEHVSETVRVMSDVWEDLHYAVVYEPNGPVGVDSDNKKLSSVKNPELFRRVNLPQSHPSAWKGEVRRYEVDASEEIQEIYAAWKQGKRWAKAHASRVAYENKIVREAEAEKRTVRKGKWVEVARGRKVPKGTKGLVFWLQDSRWGIKVGIAIPEKDGSFEKETREARSGHTYESYKNVAWTYAKNCEVIETAEVVENITKKAA